MFTRLLACMRAHPTGRESIDTLDSANLSPEPGSSVYLRLGPDVQTSSPSEGGSLGGGSLSRRGSVEEVRENWYHGLIPRAEAESRLGPTEYGTFLVRYSESTESYILSQR